MRVQRIAMPLGSVQQGQLVRIHSLPLQPALQRRLQAMGIQTGAPLEVLRRGQPGGILHVASGLVEFMIRHEQASQSEVTPVASL